MATHFPIWLQASQRRNSRENLITFCIQLVPVPMLSKRWQAGEIKKAKVEALPPYRHPRWPRELDHILHSVSTGTYAIQEMAGWRNKKGKSGSVATLSSSKMAERASGGSRSLPVSQTEEAVTLPRCYLCCSVALW